MNDLRYVVKTCNQIHSPHQHCCHQMVLLLLLVVLLLVLLLGLLLLHRINLETKTRIFIAQISLLLRSETAHPTATAV